MKRRKNNLFTVILLVAVAIILVSMIVSVLTYSPEIEKEYTYGEMIDVFEAGFDVFHAFGDVHKINDEAVFFVLFDLVDIFLAEPRI